MSKYTWNLYVVVMLVGITYTALNMETRKGFTELLTRTHTVELSK